MLLPFRSRWNSGNGRVSVGVVGGEKLIGYTKISRVTDFIEKTADERLVFFC